MKIISHSVIINLPKNTTCHVTWWSAESNFYIDIYMGKVWISQLVEKFDQNKNDSILLFVNFATNKKV